MQSIPISSITVPAKRQRKEISPEDLIALADSIAKNGLLHPIVVRQGATTTTFELVAGERRLRAVEYLGETSEDGILCGKVRVPPGSIAATDLGSLDPIDAFECELEENLRRIDLTWQERCEASAQLVELRRLQAEKRGETPTTVELVKSAAATAYPDFVPKAAETAVRKEAIVARYLSDPEVRAARTLDEGIKVIKRKEETERNIALGKSVGLTFSAKDHALLRGNCLELMASLPPSSFDCILTDPPYGIDAQTFNDSGGKASAVGHLYDDSVDNWRKLVKLSLVEFYRLAKHQAHLYIFCDIDRFVELRDSVADAGFEPFRTPLIWNNPSSQRAPWPHHGPHRRYQLCLYAMKGKRPVLKLASDVVTYASDPNLGWAAQKPVDLYRDLLLRTCLAGDTVLDPFCGSGPIFPASHGMKVKATGIELDAVAYGIAAKRLQSLK